MALILLSNDLDVGPKKDAVKSVLTEKLDLVSTVSAYAHAMTQSVLNPATDPPEAWFTTLSAHLMAAKVNAQKWLVLAPKVTADVPSSIIGFNTAFQVAVKKINQTLADARGRSLTEREKAKILDMIDMILETLADQESRIDGVSKDLVSITQAFEADHKNLTDGQNGAAAALKIAEGERKEIEDRITEIQGKLAAATEKLVASRVGWGVSLSIIVACIAFAAVFGAGLGVLVIGAVGLIGFGGGIYADTVFTKEVNELSEQLSAKQKVLDAKKQQVTALKGIINTVETLRTDNAGARAAIQEIQGMWSNLDGKLKEVSTRIKTTSTAAETLMAARLGEAATAWKDVADFAQMIQNMASGTRVQAPLLHKNLRAA